MGCTREVVHLYASVYAGSKTMISSYTQVNLYQTPQLSRDGPLQAPYPTPS